MKCPPLHLTIALANAVGLLEENKHHVGNQAHVARNRTQSFAGRGSPEC